MSKLKRLFKILTQLGFTQVGLFALYKLGLKTGYYKRSRNPQFPTPTFHSLFDLPARSDILSLLGEDGLGHLLSEADLIVDGHFRIFGGALTEIALDPGLSLAHWAEYETQPSLLSAFNIPHNDIKYLWEATRFGWAFTLGRAYHVTGDERYAKAFWNYFEIFNRANPPNMGPHWMNGQEVAIRLMAFVWAAQVFEDSGTSTRQRKEQLTQAIARHASRIVPTLLYARSQNNNHLTSEAAALYTAALAIPDHPDAIKWRKLGIKWLNWSFENQIDEKGEYIQHSVTYHRLVLQLALWVNTLNTKDTKNHKEKAKLGDPLRPSCLKKIANATRWLAELTDPISGNAVTLGANDGAYIFPLANGNFRDFRPVVNAASQTFLAEKPFGAGAWDEMGLWFNVQTLERSNVRTLNLQPVTLKPSPQTWAHLRTADGNLRLAHADQLHLDLWWQGENIVLDPGTYLYNAEAPWDNPLAATEFHNTVAVNEQDQMTRTSRFMYLDWSRGRVVEKSDSRLVVEHGGYRKQGITHRRSVSFAENTWRIEDDLVAHSQESARKYRLHWLLIDGKWRVESRDKRVEIRLQTQQGLINITLYSSLLTHHSSHFTLARAGQLLHGNTDVPPTRGWYSPTYGVKIPALSLALEITAQNAVQFTTEFNLQP